MRDVHTKLEICHLFNNFTRQCQIPVQFKQMKASNKILSEGPSVGYTLHSSIHKTSVS